MIGWPHDLKDELRASGFPVAEHAGDDATRLAILISRSATGHVHAVPASIRHGEDLGALPSDDATRCAQRIAKSLVDGLGVEGMMCVTFVLGDADDVFVDEIYEPPFPSSIRLEITEQADAWSA